MRLTRLEVKGFKSFANATTLHFGEADVIGVVGPNGSGKSNIVDAIRWVLGERKSGELRVDKMSSVIFNGTKSRRPSGVAQVQLTFDNDRGRLRTDFAEVRLDRGEEAELVVGVGDGRPDAEAHALEVRPDRGREGEVVELLVFDELRRRGHVDAGEAGEVDVERRRGIPRLAEVAAAAGL